MIGLGLSHSAQTQLEGILGQIIEGCMINVEDCGVSEGLWVLRFRENLQGVGFKRGKIVRFKKSGGDQHKERHTGEDALK